MKPKYFVDCEEVAPGVWASGDDVFKVRAAQPALPDLGKGRARTLDDIPNAGTPVEFWAFVLCLFLLLVIAG
jgi:hypothetical protein